MAATFNGKPLVEHECLTAACASDVVLLGDTVLVEEADRFVARLFPGGYRNYNAMLAHYERRRAERRRR